MPEVSWKNRERLEERGGGRERGEVKEGGGGEMGRGRERERKRETDRETEIETDGQTDMQAGRQTDRQTDMYRFVDGQTGG